MLNPFIEYESLLTWSFGIIGGVVAFFGGRKSKDIVEKKGELNNVSAELQNLSIIRDMEKALIEDARRQAIELREIISSLQTIVDQKDSIIGEQKKIIQSQGENINKQKAIVNRQDTFIKMYQSRCTNLCVDGDKSKKNNL